MDATTFPNTTQIKSHLPLRAWQAVRVTSLLGAITLAGVLIAVPHVGLFVLWKVVIPLLPLLFLVAPGLWRNICPLAASNQTPRVLGLTRAFAPPTWLREYGYVIAISLFVTFVVLRTLGLDKSGPFSALLLLGALAGGFTGGMFLKGKSGWCSTMCPLLPVQRVYGQAPLALVGNTHCQPCVGCAKNCYDFNPRAAYLADLEEPDDYWAGYRKFFVGALPGLVAAFFTVDRPPQVSGFETVGNIGLFMAVSAASFWLLDSFVKVRAHRLTTVYGAVAFSLFYWYGGPRFVDAVSDGQAPDAIGWAVRAGAIALAGAWVLRVWALERPFYDEAVAPAAGAAGSGVIATGAVLSLASNRAVRTTGPEVTFAPDDKRVVAKEGMSLLEVAEANSVPIEAGCRMGVCGADPVAVVEGAENLSPIGDDERSTLDRLGFADNTRMACCARVQGSVCMSVTPEKAKRPTASQMLNFNYNKAVEHVVVLGNGIAGVTAADHVRRRHPVCHIDVVGEEIHPLYNRMGITRLIYGRSAMQGLYLNPESWYEDRAITTWLNTRASRIDREAGHVELGTGEHLPYDRLIVATGSHSFVPPIEGFGSPGTYVLRAAADALDVRAFVQRHGARSAVVAGGGLLGLEAAYALHKLGLHTVVLERSDRLLRRQLDAPASQILRRYLEGLGLTIECDAETHAVGGNGRVSAAQLRDGRWVDAEVLIVAAGIEPNIALATDAGLRTNRGILVDRQMRSSDPVILAAGDAAEWEGQILGLWTSAVAQAEVAADSATGGLKSYGGIVPVTILKVVGIELTSIGRFEPAAPDDEVIAFEDRSGQRYRKLVINDGRIVGAILLGYSEEVAPLKTVVTRGLDVGPVLGALREGDWSVLAKVSSGLPLSPASVVH